jgi:ubiquinone/menaquinone biosynthesis C-methylase UbiE
MGPSEFDSFADEYHRLHESNVRLSGEGPAYFANQKAQMTARLIGPLPPDGAILDFGTGVGNSLSPLRSHFPGCSITAIDVSQKCLDVAQTRCGNEIDFKHFDGRRIPAADGTFSLAFAACVFHHIDHARHADLLVELKRVLRPGGWLTIFEHNPLNPLTVHAVNTCEFDRNARLISARGMRNALRGAGFTSIVVHYSVFFPAFLRFARPLEYGLRWLPLGAQYCALGRV